MRTCLLRIIGSLELRYPLLKLLRVGHVLADEFVLLRRA